MPQSEHIGIVGAGRVGQALARLLAPHYPLLIASPRHAERAAAFAGHGARAAGTDQIASDAACVVIAVPDRVVPAVAAELAGGGASVLLQTCGGIGPDELVAAGPRPVSCATFHPLQTFATPARGAEALPGSCIGVCGTGKALQWCHRLAEVLSAEVLEIPGASMAAYHAAAVLASNCAVGLLDAAVELLKSAGLEGARARLALRPLVQASLSNALTMESDRALTGPVARGDALTLKRHLEGMRHMPAPLQDLYRVFGTYMVTIATRSGADPESVAEMRSVLEREP